MNSKAQSFEKGAFILILSTALVKIIGAIFKIPISNLLSDRGFGYFSLAYDMFSPVYALSSVGLPVAAARVFAEGKGKIGIKNIEKPFLRIGAFLCLAVMCAALLVMLISRDFKGMLCYLALMPAIIVSFCVSAYRGYFEFKRNMIPTAVSDIIQALFKLAAGYGFAYLTFKLTDRSYLGAAGAILGISLGVIVSLIYIKSDYRKNKTGDLNSDESLIDAKKVLLITLPIAAAALCSTMTNLIDSVTVKTVLSLKSVSFDINAVYGVRSKAYTLFNFVVSFVSVIGVSAFPIIIKANENKDFKKSKKALLSVMKLSSVLAVPAALGLFAMAEPIMSLLFSGEMSETLGARILTLFAPAALFAGLAIPLISVMQAYKLEKFAFKAVAIGAALKLVLNIMLMAFTSFEIEATVSATVICYLFILLYLIKILKNRNIIDLKDILIYLKPVPPAIVSVSAAYIIEKYTNSSLLSALSFAAAAVICLLIIMAFGIVSKEEIKNCIKR